MSNCTQHQNSFEYKLCLWRRASNPPSFISRRMASSRHLINKKNKKWRERKSGCGDDPSRIISSSHVLNNREHIVENVWDLLCSVNISLWNARIQTHPFKLPIQVHMMRPLNMAPVRASALDCHLFHSYTVLKDKLMSTITEPFRARQNVINGLLDRLGGFWISMSAKGHPSAPLAISSNTPTTKSTMLIQRLIPFSKQCPKILLQPLCCSVTLPKYT